MKLRTLLGTILILALLSTAASAQTENKDLPSQGEITNYLSGMQSSNFVESASEACMNDNPTWKWDTWTDATGMKFISFYYAVDSAKGYGSIYYDDSGKQLPKMCGIETTLVKSYAGGEPKKETPVEEVTETEKQPAQEEEIVTETDAPAEEIMKNSQKIDIAMKAIRDILEMLVGE